MTSPVPGPDDAPLVGVVVVSFRSVGLVRANLAARSWPARVRVVVVDNHSSDTEAADLAEVCAEAGFTFVPLPDNGGFGRGCNAGVAAAAGLGCSAVVLLNPDASAEPEVIVQLADAALEDPSALVSPRVEDLHGRTVFEGARLSLADGRIRSRPDAPLRRAQPWLTGACMAMSLELHRRVGGVPEAYFLYWEDVELSHRCVAAGGRLVLRSDLVVVHDAGGTQGGHAGPGKSALYYRWNMRNRLHFAARNLRRRDLVLWMLTTPAVGLEILMRGGRRQLVQRPSVLMAALRGTVEGLLIASARLLRGPVKDRGRRQILVAHPGADLYGSDRVVVQAVRALVDDGADVTVTVPVDGPLVAELRAAGGRVVPCRAPVLRKAVLRPRGAVSALGDAVGGAWPALRLVLRAGRDGVLVNTLTLPSWVVWARVARRPVVCHVHEAEAGAARVFRAALAVPAVLSSGVVVNSDYTREVLAATAPRTARAAQLVRNAVPGPGEPIAPRPQLDGVVRLLFIGRLSPRKGPDVAVSVLEELVSRGRDVHLTLLGDVFPGYEWFRDDLRRRLRAARLEERVRWAGFQRDVWPEFAAADIALVPSTSDESFGNTVVEAALAARPVLVSDSSGLREAAAERPGARLLPVGDVSRWADAVGEVIDEWSTRREEVMQDSAVARADFAADSFGRDFARAFRALVGAR